MFESTLNSSIIYYVMGVITLGGMASKLVVSMTLKKLVKAASEMSKSTHSFMKYVRAKFEHACMVSDHVENIDVFVDKYLCEFQVWGLRLYSWQRLENIFAVALAIMTLYISGATYYYVGMGQVMLQRTMIGAGLLILLVGVYQLVDEKFRLQTAKVYMVDYLENVCAHRYARGASLKERSVVPSALAQDRDDRSFADKLDEQMTNIEQNEARLHFDQPVTQQIAKQMSERMNEKKELQLRAKEEAEKRQELRKQKQEEYMPNEETIREILQEFMA